MKKIIYIALILLLFAATPVFAQKNYTDEWKQFDNLVQQRLPQSVEKTIDGIY